MIKRLLQAGIALLLRYKFILLYLLFGGLTTLINLAIYALFYSALGFANIPSTVIAWVIAVVFAFVTNKIFVFESKQRDTKHVVRELSGFFVARLFTGVFDVLFMYVAVSLLGIHALAMKLVSNIVVTIINYFTSKWLVFRK